MWGVFFQASRTPPSHILLMYFFATPAYTWLCLCYYCNDSLHCISNLLRSNRPIDWFVLFTHVKCLPAIFSRLGSQMFESIGRQSKGINQYKVLAYGLISSSYGTFSKILPRSPAKSSAHTVSNVFFISFKTSTAFSFKNRFIVAPE